MDLPEILKELTNLVMAIAAAITAVMAIWIKLSQNRNAVKSSEEKQEIKEEIKLEIAKTKEKLQEQTSHVEHTIQVLKDKINPLGDVK